MRDSLYILVNRIIGYICIFINSIIIARSLGAAGKGEYAFYFLILSYLIFFGNIGIGGSSVYFHGKKEFDIKDIISTDFYFNICFGLFLTLIGIFYNYIGEIKKGTDNNLFYIIFLIVPFVLTSNDFQSNFQALKKFKQTAIIETSISLSSLVLNIYIYCFCERKLIYFFTINIVFRIIRFISYFTYLKIKKYFIIYFSKIFLKKSFIFSIKSYFGRISQFLNLRFDQMILGLFLNLRDLGLYTVAVGMTELIWFVSGSISTVILPRLTESDKSIAEKLLAKVNVLNILISFILIVFLLLFGKFIIDLFYGKEFIDSYIAVLILIPGTLTLSISKILTKYIFSSGKPEYLSYSSFISFLINIILCILLIPKYGIIGAATATSFTYTVRFFIDLYFMDKVSENKIFYFFRINMKVIRNLKENIKWTK